MTPYDKHYVAQQLRAGAGYILEDFNESQVRVHLLIYSNSHRIVETKGISVVYVVQQLC